jgi:glycosyltransferase involved in cell wall biosynthesis
VGPRLSTFSIITPTLGRESLKTMLDSVLPQIMDRDEVIVIGDGPQPRAKEICKAAKSSRVTYYEVPFTGNYGNPARNDAIQKAKGTHLFFVDDDDVVLPEAIPAMRRAADKHPGVPLVFKMHHQLIGIIYRSYRVAYGDISGQMFVVPNVKGKLGRWSGRYSADFDFITSTLALYPKKENSAVFLEEVTVKMGYSGAKGVELP